MKTITLRIDDDDPYEEDDSWRVNINGRTYIDGEALPEDRDNLIRNLEYRLQRNEQECQRLRKMLEEKERELQKLSDWGASQAKQLLELKMRVQGDGKPSDT